MFNMKDINEDLYNGFKKSEGECHSHNLQMALDLMKDAKPKERTVLEKFTRNSCKEYNANHWGNVWSKPIVWKKEWNAKPIK